MAHQVSSWSEVAGGRATDIALLQESVPPPDGLDVETWPTRDQLWQTSGGRRNFCAAVARFGRRATIKPLMAHPVHETPETPSMLTSRPGSIAAVDVTLENSEKITLVSMYAAWESPREGSWIYADASAHRLISDLSFLVSSQTGHSIIAAGDLNILNGYGEQGSPYWGRRYRSVFDRMAAIGIPFVGPQAPNGIQAVPPTSELPEDSKDVPTFRTRREDPSTATRQLDFVFASASLHSRLSVRALNRPEEWGPSDHCRVEIELGPP